VTFLIYTGWLPQFVKADPINRRWFEDKSISVMPADLGYHSKKKIRSWQKRPSLRKCDYCDGKPCYYDGSGLNAYDAMYALVNGGDEALWKFLDEYYDYVFMIRTTQHRQNILCL